MQNDFEIDLKGTSGDHSRMPECILQKSRDGSYSAVIFKSSEIKLKDRVSYLQKTNNGPAAAIGIVTEVIERRQSTPTMDWVKFNMSI